MAADPIHAKEASPSFVRSDKVFCNSACHCSLLKRDIQVFVNEIKSMTEIINILKEDLNYGTATKQDRMLNNVHEGKPKTSSFQC